MTPAPQPTGIASAHAIAADPQVFVLRAGARAWSVHDDREGDTRLGQIELLLDHYYVAFPGEAPQPFRFDSLEAAVGYFVEYSFACTLGLGGSC